MGEVEIKVIKGVRLGCRYSYRCNGLRELDFPELEAERFISASATLRPSLIRQRLPRVLEILKKLIPYYYYQLIAARAGRTDFFSQDIVQAHWLGNGVPLSPLGKTDISAFLKRGDIPRLREGNQADREKILLGPIRRIRNLAGGLPHHNFDVLLQVKGAKAFTPRILMDLNSCLVRPALVVGFQDFGQKTLLRVKTIGLVVVRKGKLVLQNVEEFVDSGFAKRLKPEEYVAIHFGWAREKITQETADRLKAITTEALTFSRKKEKG